MRSHHPKLKTHPRPLFSCAFFCQCTQTAPSPTAPNPPPLRLSPPSPHTSLPPPPPPPPQPPSDPPPQKPESSSSSSSSSTSQSFTQWRFPLSNSPLHSHHPDPLPETRTDSLCPSDSLPLPLPVQSSDVQELFHVAELQLSSGSESEHISALYLLERTLVPNPPSEPVCPSELMRGVVTSLKRKAGAKPATKVLLALCLADGNRRVAVEAGAVGTVVEVVMELEGPAAERALAALELTCTVAEGAAELRTHALAVPVMVTMMGKMAGRGREYAISALGVIYGNGDVPDGEQVQHAPPEEVARAVELALQGDCTARGRRKGNQLLKCLKDYGRSDSTQETTQRS